MLKLVHIAHLFTNVTCLCFGLCNFCHKYVKFLCLLEYQTFQFHNCSIFNRFLKISFFQIKHQPLILISFLTGMFSSTTMQSICSSYALETLQLKEYLKGEIFHIEKEECNYSSTTSDQSTYIYGILMKRLK